MKVMHLVPGTPEWDAHRFAHFNASELAAAMGLSKKMSRSQLLHLKATGNEREFSSYVRDVILASGHRAEALAREQVAIEIGEDLFPIIGVSDDDPRLSASFDGVNLDKDETFECKVWNQKLVEQVRSGELSEDDFPEHIYQMEQQLLINTSSESIRFVVAKEDGSEKVEMRYRSVPDRRAKIIPTWNQFEADLAAYVPAAPAVEVVGRAPETLPALRIEVTGAVTASNLADFKATALAVINAVNDDLQTDEDFADAEKAVKWCSDVEKRLVAAKEAALAQTADIDALFKAIDDIAAEASTKRLNLTKKVDARKVSIRVEIQQAATVALTAHLADLTRKAGVSISVPANFAEAMKGKKTITSLRDAADSELARAKIDANLLAERVTENQRIMDELGAGHAELFADRSVLVLKHADDLTAAIHSRIAQHKARAAAEAERIERETRLKIEREQQAREAAEEAARIAAARAAQQLAAHQAKVERAAEDFGGTEKVIVTESAPAPAAIAEVPAPVVTPKAAPLAEIPRPSDEDLIFAVAHSFAVPTSVAAGWLRTMNQAALAKAAA